jgi:methylmalonyl-CoA/ethylmalonyl-CoA epimerase
MPKFVKNPFEEDQPIDLDNLSGEPEREPVEPEDAANTEPLLTEIDHVAIAVNDLGDAIDFYRESFGAIVEHREIVESDGVEEALLKVADSYIQLLTPTRDDSPVAKYLEKKGEGLHHVGYRVADCGAALDAYRAAGGRSIDDTPRPGSRNTTVAFLHPKTSFGTLIELVQE